MTLNTNLVDLATVVGMLASWGIVPNALQFLRDMFLDALLAHATDAQRAAILRALLFLLSLGGILLLACVVLGQPFTLNLAISAILAASGGTVGAHMTYKNLQKAPSLASVAPTTPLIIGSPLVMGTPDAPDPFAPIVVPSSSEPDPSPAA